MKQKWPNCLFAVSIEDDRVCALDVFPPAPSPWNCQACDYRKLDRYQAFDKILEHQRALEARGAPTTYCDQARHAILAAHTDAKALLKETK
jgi:hypothetical protein